MFFKKIEMHGFKSFAEPVTIEFNQGLTGIVGPNGSGKSNISDAIRWVLGEQSPSKIRGGKMEEVIFAGTSSRKSRGMAEVTLVIDNSDHSLPIDYQEVAITRRMFRSGESEYHINGNQCRLMDIRNLIVDTGIGVDGYSLIGQGKIADIISNRTEDRREIFEEAAGIVAYRTRKAQAERKLASTTANMDRVRDIIGEIEGRIDGLREESIKAKEYLKLRDRHKELEINIILKNVDKLELNNEYVRDDIAELELALENLKEERAGIEERLAQAGQKKESLDEIEKEARQEHLAAIDSLNAIRNKSEVDSERLSAIEENVSRLDGELVQIAEKIEREKSNRQEVEASRADMEAEEKQARDNLNAKTELYDDAVKELAGLSEEMDSARNDIFNLSSDINRARSEINSLDVLKETLEKRRKALMEEKDSGEDSGQENRKKLEEIKAERQTAASDIEAKRTRIDSLGTQLAGKRQQEKTLSVETEEIRISLGQMSARKRTIEEMENNYEGYNSAVRFVMKSSMSGIRGVVADLIRVPREYSTAIETALGASLQNIVCDDDESAKKAIRALKENKAGRMTFLPLGSIKEDRKLDERLRSETGFIGFGSECIEFDGEYSDIVDYLLAGVVLVDDMDNAIRISKKSGKVRVVTLDGEIINSAGAITGGRHKNKTADILQRKAEIQELEKEIRDKTEIQKKKTDELEECRSSIQKISDESSTLEGELIAAEQSIIMLDNDIKMAENALSDIQSSEERIERELASIDEEEKRSANMVEELMQVIEKNQVSMKETEASIEEKQKLHEEKQEAFEHINEEITRARIAVTSCEERSSHFKYVLSEATRAIAELEEEIVVKEAQKKANEEERQQITSGHGDMDALIEEKEEDLKRVTEYLDEVTGEKSQMDEEITSMMEDRDSMTEKGEEIQTRKYEAEIRKAKNETQLENLKEKLWEEFEVSYIQAMEFKAEDFVMSSAVKENRQIKNRMKEMGEVNIGAIEEYETVKERYDFLTAQEADIQQAMDSLVGIIKDMDKTIRERFKASFDQIVVNFEEIFTDLFAGGHAELRLSDESDPLTSDIDIVAQPPGKKLQNINLLSGGEKTLTAIALMFAVLKAKPTPFCILDEVEAALDDTNIDRFIQALRKFDDIQFALVTHQKATMEHADVLYGVTMPEKGISKVLSLDLAEGFDPDEVGLKN